MLKKNKPVDERIRALQHKIFTEAYYIVLFGLVISFFIKQLVLDLPAASYLTEFLLILGSCLYVNIRNMVMGVDAYQNSTANFKKRLILTCLVTGTTLTIMLAVTRYHTYSSAGQGMTALGIFFTTCTLSMLVVSFISWKLYQKRMLRLEKKLNEEESEL